MIAMTDVQAFLSEREMKTLLRRQQNLLELSLRDVDLAHLCPHLSGIIETPFAVVNFSGQLVFNNTGLEDWAVIQKWPWRDRPQTVTVDQLPLRRFSLIHGENRVGNILFKADPRAGVGTEEMLLTQSARIVARALTRAPASRPSAAAPHTLDELLQLYLEERLCTDTLVESCAEAGVALPHADYQCALIVRRDMTDAILSAEDKERLLQDLNRFVQMPSESGLWCSVEGALLLILPVPPRLRPTAITGVIGEWVADLQRRTGNRFSAAVSDPKESPRGLRDAYLETRAVTRFNNGIGEGANVAAYKDFDFAVLFDEVSRERMLRFTRSVLKGLPNSGEAKEAKLMASLEAFIENECNIATAAQTLSVHKNTLSYRLDRASELLGIDLRHSDDLLRLKLAFILRKIIRRTEMAIGRDPFCS